MMKEHMELLPCGMMMEFKENCMKKRKEIIIGVVVIALLIFLTPGINFWDITVIQSTRIILYMSLLVSVSVTASMIYVVLKFNIYHKKEMFLSFILLEFLIIMDVLFKDVFNATSEKYIFEIIVNIYYAIILKCIIFSIILSITVKKNKTNY